ncbi:hypothetical protein [Nostoc sp. C117]|uniref:hypothetical protein n=1 Tax=Nostoc sp. C117 TaxID=3349875 RepID=UPI00370D0DB6
MQQLIINPKNLPIVEISPMFRGQIALIDLLRSEGQIAFQARFVKQPQGNLFRVIDQEYHFIVEVIDSELVIQRNDEAVSLDISQVVLSSSDICFVINWSPRHLRLLCGNPGGTMYDTGEQSTQVVVPPPSLVEWARKQNLLPVTEYASEEEFRQRVYSALLSVKDKVAEIGAINSFWNISYNGSKIDGRFPKRETDIHPTIHSLLHDQMLMGSVRVIPERQTGVGDLDFSFVGAVQGRGTCEVFAEFKLAHSKDVYHGLEQQLPDYMRNKGIKYSAYCVLWFKCEWFGEPKNLLLADMEMELIARLPNTNLPGIRVFVFDFGKGTTAST